MIPTRCPSGKCSFEYRPKHRIGNIGGSLIVSAQQMSVGVESDARVGVTSPLRDDMHRDTIPQKMRYVAMPETVERYALHGGGFGGKALRECIGI